MGKARLHTQEEKNDGQTHVRLFPPPLIHPMNDLERKPRRKSPACHCRTTTTVVEPSFARPQGYGGLSSCVEASSVGEASATTAQKEGKITNLPEQAFGGVGRSHTGAMHLAANRTSPPRNQPRRTPNSQPDLEPGPTRHASIRKLSASTVRVGRVVRVAKSSRVVKQHGRC